MGKFVGFLIGVGVTAAIAGGVLFAVGFAANEKEKKEGVDTKEYVATESFEDIDVDLICSKLKIEKAADGVNKVVYGDKDKLYNEVAVKDNKLTIKQVDDRPWYKRWLFNFNWYYNDELTVTIYLAGDTYNSLVASNQVNSIEVAKDFSFKTVDLKTNTGSVSVYASATESVKAVTNTGSVHAKGLTTASLKCSADTGSVNVESVTVNGDADLHSATGTTNVNESTFNNLKVENSTGTINVNNSTASGEMNLKTSTGSIRLSRVDAASMKLKTSTGSITGSVLTAKNFKGKSSTGSVDLPDSDSSAGVFDAETSTGSIRITIAD